MKFSCSYNITTNAWTVDVPGIGLSKPLTPTQLAQVLQAYGEQLQSIPGSDKPGPGAFTAFQRAVALKAPPKVAAKPDLMLSDLFDNTKIEGL